MPEPLRYTLVCDGPTDRALMPIINWLLGSIPGERCPRFVDQLADLGQLPDPPRTLSDRAARAVSQFPCDVLFVHRDAEREPLETRVQEIDAAVSVASIERFVPVVPVRMTEAWLLINENAIRYAADNPNGRAAIELPALRDLEKVPDPKQILQRALLVASEKKGRRKRQFERDLSRRMVRVSEYIDDFSPLRSLPAFCHLEEAVTRVLSSLS